MLAEVLRARIPATWVLVAVLLLVHVGSGAALLYWDAADWPEALVMPRGVRARVMVGGQHMLPVMRGRWWRLFTSVLLHVDALHLLLNASSIWILGWMLEPRVGPWRLLAWFALGGLAGSLLSFEMGVRQSDGASGGAFALLAIAVVLGWRLRATLSEDDRLLWGPLLQGFLVFNLVLSFVLPFLDAAAHVGGMALGLGVGLVAKVERSRAADAVSAAVVLAFAGVCVAGWLRWI